MHFNGKWMKRNNSTVTKQMRIMLMFRMSHLTIEKKKKKNKMGKTERGSVCIGLAG